MKHSGKIMACRQDCRFLRDPVPECRSGLTPEMAAFPVKRRKPRKNPDRPRQLPVQSNPIPL